VTAMSDEHVDKEDGRAADSSSHVVCTAQVFSFGLGKVTMSVSVLHTGL